MKLYFSPGTCSLSPQIVLKELGLPYEPVAVDLNTRKTAAGEDFVKINPKGYVPALQLDDGQILTEGPAIVQYLADRKPEAKLAPANGTVARAHLQEMLNFLSTEVHKSFSPFFDPAMPEEAKTIYRAKLGKRFDELSAILSGKDHLLGEFSVADAYLFTVLGWTKIPFVRVDLSQWPVLVKYAERIGARPSVRAALDVEAAVRKPH